MIHAKAKCQKCEYTFSQSGDIDDGGFVERVLGVAQDHSDIKQHDVKFSRHEHPDKTLTPRKNAPGPGLRTSEHFINNPLNDSYV